ncbi:MAG: hypothetical protein KKA19_04240 [Candidatus Margulisbacteria bacterium]|nr:hypothetical protein [Candidatus Margulisiibacteriota bacterium]
MSQKNEFTKPTTYIVKSDEDYQKMASYIRAYIKGETEYKKIDLPIEESTPREGGN